jgi:hypothetical protein
LEVCKRKRYANIIVQNENCRHPYAWEGDFRRLIDPVFFVTVKV